MTKRTTLQKSVSSVRQKELPGDDILTALKSDHEPLKKLIKVLKDTKKSLKERRIAFEDFRVLLTIHVQAEANVFYTFLKEEAGMHQKAFEGDTEHSLVEQLLDAAKMAEEDEDKWSAKVKVLAELVEHHIKEEEENLFPKFKSTTAIEDRKNLAAEYIVAKSQIEVDERQDNLNKTQVSEAIVHTQH